MFEVGSRVVVLPLGRKQGVIVDAGRGGRYRVQVENTTVSCREGDLIAAAELLRRKRTPREAAHTRIGDEARPALAPTIDLHGLSVDEALARVVEAIDTALQRGAERLEVVHGKGSGRIRDALHRHLTTLTVVASFRLDPGNPGVTWIYL
jgi:DNA mismatch repair protein MutS2